MGQDLKIFQIRLCVIDQAEEGRIWLGEGKMSPTLGKAPEMLINSFVIVSTFGPLCALYVSQGQPQSSNIF